MQQTQSTDTTPTTSETHPAAIERIVEQTIGVFRTGYRLSFALVIAGIIIAIIRRIELATELGGPAQIARDIADLDPNGFIGLGIGVMILTPIIMTVEVAINFLRGGDRRFAMITGVVAIILIVTMTLAFI